MVQTIAAHEPPPLAELAESKSLAMFLDFDGTLVELAATPDSILLAEGLAERLESLSERLAGRFALVSGRSLDNIARFLGPIAIARAGSHGVERMLADGTLLGEAPQPIAQEAVRQLADYAEHTQGTAIERKRYGAALHFRANPSLESEATGFAQEVADTFGLWLKRGNCVAELVQPGATKAGAVKAFMADPVFAGTMPVFVGDDITDEDGFSAASEFGGYGIIVGGREDTIARYRLPTVGKVHEWLKL